MAKQLTINIEIQYQQHYFDLQIPKYVTQQRLEALISLNREQLPINLPQQWQLILQGKQVRLATDVLLVNYPISDGDQFIIQEVVGKQ